MYANRNHMKVNMYIPFDNPFETSEAYGPSTTSKDEHILREAPRIYQFPNINGDVIPASYGTSVRKIWKSNYHLFELNLDQNAEFRNNTLYFPVWIAKIDGREAEVRYRQDEFKRLRIAVPKGTHTVEFFFKEPWYRMLANTVSVSSLLVLLFVAFLKLFRLRFRLTCLLSSIPLMKFPMNLF